MDAKGSNKAFRNEQVFPYRLWAQKYFLVGYARKVLDGFQSGPFSLLRNINFFRELLWNSWKAKEGC